MMNPITLSSKDTAFTLFDKAHDMLMTGIAEKPNFVEIKRGGNTEELEASLSYLFDFGEIVPEDKLEQMLEGKDPAGIITSFDVLEKVVSLTKKYGIEVCFN